MEHVTYYTPNACSKNELNLQKYFFVGPQSLLHRSHCFHTLHWWLPKSLKQSYLALLLLWVTGVHSVLHSCDPNSTDSGLKSTDSCHHSAGPDSGGILTLILESTQMPNRQLSQPFSSLSLILKCHTSLLTLVPKKLPAVLQIFNHSILQVPALSWGMNKVRVQVWYLVPTFPPKL